MLRLALIFFALAATAGCADGQFIRDKFTSTTCGGGGISLTGYTATIIRYGDSRLNVIPISKVLPGTEFRFVLLPKIRETDAPIDYEKAIVMISSDDDDADSPADWLEAKGTFSDSGSHTLVTCVPTRENLSKTKYKYKVSVSYPSETDIISYIDPRVEIKNEN